MKKRILFCFSFFLTALSAFSQPDAKSNSFVYACPPCDRDCDTIHFAQAGTCPYCGMALEKISLTAWHERLSKLAANPVKKLTVCFYLQDGVEVLDFAGPMEVFSAAGFDVFTVSRTTDVRRSQGILSFKADYDISTAPPSDVIVVFGGAFEQSVNDTALISWVRARSQAAQYTMSVCTGAFILAKAGVLDHLTATTYHSWVDELGRQAPKTKVLHNVRLVDNGKVITTAGVSAGMDGALHLVEKIQGRETAKNVAAMIEYDKWVPEQGLVVKH